jgi:hypothetical protein
MYTHKSKDMTTNEFKNGHEPKKIEQPRPKLNPPKFEEALISFHNPNIFWHQALKKEDSGHSFKR